jgi:hypothetical protein
MSALFGSSAVLFLGTIVFHAICGADERDEIRFSRTAGWIVAVSSGLLFAFSRTLWQISIETEVYSLAAFFVLLILRIVLPHLRPIGVKGSVDRGRLVTTIAAIGYFFGLALGNHMSVILVAPLILYLFFRQRIWRRERRPAFLGFTVFLLLGLTVYLYLPLRAALDPPLNWGDPVTLSSLIRHVSGWQYRVWMFAGGSEVLIRNLGNYLHLLSEQFPMVLLPLAGSGMIFLFRRRRPILWALLILFGSDLAYSVNYDIPDIDPYFIPSFAVLVVLIGSGVIPLIEFGARWRHAAALWLAILSLLMPVSALWSNYRICDRSEDYMAREWAVNLFSVVPEGAMVLTRTWDLYAPAIYLQLIEGLRRDVVMIDYELMRRSWYVRQMSEAHPDVFRPARKEIETFLPLVQVFEQGGAFDSRRLDRAFYGMLNAILIPAVPEGRAFIDFDDNPAIVPSLKKEPRGVIFRLVETYSDESFDISGFRLVSTLDSSIYRDERARWIKSIYTLHAVKEGIRLGDSGKHSEAIESLGNAYRFDPNNPLVLHLLGESYLRTGSLERARGSFQRLIELAPDNVAARRRLEEIDRRIREEL